MTNSYTHAESRLLELICSNDHKVVSLKGNWGTGKTHLWKSVERKLLCDTSRKSRPIYVSLFGARTIEELKMRVLQNAFLQDEKAFQRTLKTGSRFISDLVNKFTGVSTTATALIWLPNLISGKLIVIDDIERKHVQLDIDELLGFVDEYSENHQAHFLIMLNSDKLGNNELTWKVLHEKVIDAELTLSPSPAECFEIASRGFDLPQAEIIRGAIDILQITNIRVIKRILKIIAYVGDNSELHEVSPSRWIPSTILLSASHFHAISNPPSFDYIMSYNRYSAMSDKKRDPTHVSWNALLSKLEILLADEFEELLHSYLLTGNLDTAQLKTIAQRYIKEAQYEATNKQWDDFYKAVWWDPHKTGEELRVMAEALLPTVKFMSPRTITDIASVVNTHIDGGLPQGALSARLVSAWIHEADARPEFQKLEERIIDDTHKELHPAILAKLEEMRDLQFPPISIIEASNTISKRSWSDRERIALSRSTVQQYEDALRQLRHDDLRKFVQLHIEWITSHVPDDKFKNGAANFVSACSNIRKSLPNTRFSSFITDVFQRAGIEDRLL